MKNHQNLFRGVFKSNFFVANILMVVLLLSRCLAAENSQPVNTPSSFLSRCIRATVRIATHSLAAGNGPNTYWKWLDLNDYPLEGKKLLDVGTGMSRFTQFINIAYLGTKTSAVGVDHEDLPFFFRSRAIRKADASSLPFEDNSIDLTTSVRAWGVWFEPKSSLLEMLRVTRDQIRIVTAESELIKELLLYEPKVKKIEERRYPYGTLVIIHLHPVSPK